MNKVQHLNFKYNKYNSLRLSNLESFRYKSRLKLNNFNQFYDFGLINSENLHKLQKIGFYDFGNSQFYCNKKIINNYRIVFVKFNKIFGMNSYIASNLNYKIVKKLSKRSKIDRFYQSCKNLIGLRRGLIKTKRKGGYSVACWGNPENFFLPISHSKLLLALLSNKKTQKKGGFKMIRKNGKYSDLRHDVNYIFKVLSVIKKKRNYNYFKKETSDFSNANYNLNYIVSLKKVLCYNRLEKKLFLRKTVSLKSKQITKFNSGLFSAKIVRNVKQ